MKIFFIVNFKSLEYFSHKFNVNFPIAKFLKDSKNQKKIIKNLRETNYKELYNVFYNFFGKEISKKISVEIFPEYFGLGAANIKDKTIIIGQKNRSKYFYLGLLVHEISHILLYAKNKNKLINEVFCMLLEYYIYDNFESKKIDDIRSYKELDDFHKKAFKYALKFYKNFSKSVKKGESVEVFLSFLKKEIKNEDLHLEPPIGLLANLNNTYDSGKNYFSEGCLIRKEHFGILILLPYGKRFRVDNKFWDVLKNIHNKTSKETEKSSKLKNKEIDEFLLDCYKKGIISKKTSDSPRIIENKYVSDDCLSFPRTVYWELTQLCNLQCIHCYSNSMSKGFRGLDFKTIKKTIDELIEKGVEFLNIGGGEPLIYKDIYKVLKYTTSKGLMIEMTTNGTLINDQSIKKLKKSGIKFIQISLDGSCKKIYEKIRVNSNFEKTIRSIRELIDAGFVVSINTVLMKHNKDDIINIIKLCKKLGVSYFKVSPLMETGRGFANMNNIQLSLVEYKDIYKKILKYQKDHISDNMKIIIYQNILKPEIKNIGWMPENHYGCPAGRTTCGIDSYGNVYPCSYMNHKELACGNIKDYSLSEIWKKSQVMKKIRNIDKITGKCNECKFLNLCRGGCRAMAYLRYKKLDATDPLCVVNL